MFHTRAVDHHPASLQASSAVAVTHAWNCNAVAGTDPKQTYCKSLANVRTEKTAFTSDITMSHHQNLIFTRCVKFISGNSQLDILANSHVL